MPVVVATFDFAFCLRSGSVAEGDAVKPESLAELGESVRDVGEKEGVIIDIKRKREAVGEEGAGEKMEVRRKILPAPSSHPFGQKLRPLAISLRSVRNGKCGHRC